MVPPWHRCCRAYRSDKRAYRSQHRQPIEAALSRACAAAFRDMPDDPLAHIAASLSTSSLTAANFAPDAATIETPAEDEATWTASAWLSSLSLRTTIAAALRLPAPEEQYEYMRTLTRDRLVELLRARGLEGFQPVIWEGVTKLQQPQQLATAGAISAKFKDDDSIEMRYGAHQARADGLEALIGPPLMLDGSMYDQMRHEHQRSADSTEPFCSSTGVTTTSYDEFEFVDAPDPNKRYADRGGDFQTEHPEWCRTPLPLEELKRRMEAQNDRLYAADLAQLLVEEVTAGRLYTGPMYEKYNAVLRAFNGAELQQGRARELCQGNTYATTIHAINSLLVKAKMLTVVCPVWRGCSKARVPDSLMCPNAANIRGGVELGFMSTTTGRDQAMHNAAGRASIVFELAQGMGDRGADVSWLSQYPHEREVLFPPLTGVEILETRCEGSTLVLQCRLSISQVTHTLEHWLSERFNVSTPDGPRPLREVIDEFVHKEQAGRAEVAKFSSLQLKAGRPADAALGVNKYLNVPDKKIWEGMSKGTAAIKAEMETHGSDSDKACLEYVLSGTAGSSTIEWKHAGDRRMDVFDDESRADGRAGQPLAYFVHHEKSKQAGLLEEHVVALRLYTTAAYAALNDPLRGFGARATKKGNPHPFPITISFISDGIRRLRAVAASNGDAHQPRDFWRGIRNVELPDTFTKEGGTEFAPMSTSSDFQVALAYSDKAEKRLIIKVATESFMERGADLQFLSAFPGEVEFLYPPLTFLKPTGKEEVLPDVGVGVGETPIGYRVIEVTPHI